MTNVYHGVSWYPRCKVCHKILTIMRMGTHMRIVPCRDHPDSMMVVDEVVDVKGWRRRTRQFETNGIFSGHVAKRKMQRGSW